MNYFINIYIYILVIFTILWCSRGYLRRRSATGRVGGIRADRLWELVPISFALPFVCAVLTVRASTDGMSDSPAADYDCGTLALYTLLRLEGRAIRLRDVDASLPAPPPQGFSMEQLRDAASSFGVSLMGVHLPRQGSPDRPALVFTRHGPHGHFSVVRPIGHTGKLVQTIDALREPDVVDLPDLITSPEWTGLALIPSRPNWPARIGWCLLGGTIAGGLAVWVLPRLRRRSVADPIVRGS